MLSDLDVDDFNKFNENLKSNTERKKVTTSLFKRLFKFSKIKEKEKNIIDSNNNNNISNSSDSNNSSQQVHKTHPLAYHTSRILDDEIAKLNLKSNDSLLNDLDVNSII